MFSNCILHIGMEKTGTTTIQAMLSQSRPKLRESGYFYSRIMGRDNHVNLIVYARNDDVTDNQRKRALAQQRYETIKDFRRWLRGAFAKEAKKLAGKTLVLSNEHLQSRATCVEEKQRIYDLLSKHCKGKPQIYLYLRRQDQVAVSLYGTRFLSGALTEFGTIFPSIPEDGSVPYFYDYLTIWREWCQVFGQENVHVRLFDPANFREKDVGMDFLDWTGISESCPLERIERQNESISKASQYFLSRMNEMNPVFIDGAPNALRGRLPHRVLRLGKGKGLQPARAEAEAFYAHFRESNAILFKEAGLAGENFPETFDQFPESADPSTVAVDEVADLGVKLYMDVMEELASVSAELAELKKAAEKQ